MHIVCLPESGMSLWHICEDTCADASLYRCPLWRGRVVLGEEDGQWTKLAGSWMVYVVEGDSHGAMWAQSKKHSEQAQKA